MNLDFPHTRWSLVVSASEHASDAPEDRFHFIVALTTYREVGSPANLRFRIVRSVFRGGEYSGGVLIKEGLANRTHPPELALSKDGDLSTLGIHYFDAFPVFQFIRHDGGGAIGFLSDSGPHPELRSVKNDSRDGALAIIGHNDEGLLVHFRNSAGTWTTDLVQTADEIIRPGFDIGIRPGGSPYYVTFANDLSMDLPARMLFRSPLTIDADCDGLPLFMELAFDRSPNFPEEQD